FSRIQPLNLILLEVVRSPRVDRSGASKWSREMNLNRRALLAGVASSFFAVSAAEAANKVQFDAAAFKAARDSGKPVVLQVAATWCGPCQRMKRTVSELVEKPEFKDVTIFEADYDANKEELQKLHA